jgi:4a-hydroxytetrahydrobiopterin dehydratase
MTNACSAGIEGSRNLNRREAELSIFPLAPLRGTRPAPPGNSGEDTGMEELARMKCAACRRDAPTVTEAEIADFHPQVSGWEIVEQDGVRQLTRVFPFDDFGKALRFTDTVGELAEEEGHHPALLTEWGRTRVTWWTHKIRGLHRNDFIMAAKTDELYRRAERREV